MLMIKVEFFKASMFGELALKFIHTSAEHVSEIQVILKEFWYKFLPKGKIKWMDDADDREQELCSWMHTINNYFNYSTLPTKFVVV